MGLEDDKYGAVTGSKAGPIVYIDPGLSLGIDTKLFAKSVGSYFSRFTIASRILRYLKTANSAKSIMATLEMTSNVHQRTRCSQNVNMIFSKQIQRLFKIADSRSDLISAHRSGRVLNMGPFHSA